MGDLDQGNVPEICFDVKLENTGARDAQVATSFTQPLWDPSGLKIQF